MADPSAPVPRAPPPPRADGALQAALQRLRASATLRLALETPVCVAVIALGRYLADERAADGAADGYSYDVTITDGQSRAKCHLSPGLNRLVHTNALRCGSCALVSRFSVVYDERRLERSRVRIEDARCGADDARILRGVTDATSLRWWSGLAEPCDAPLQPSRKHYLPLWNDEDPAGAAWEPRAAPPDVVLDVSKLSLVADLAASFCGSRRPRPLLVRVLHRSRLRYYGRPGRGVDLPFQAYFEVADQSGVTSMVLWNDLCPRWYRSLAVGSVLYLQHYTLKPGYRNRSRPQLGQLPLLTFHNIEICLNPRNPSADVTLVPPKSVQPQWGLPEVTFNFSTRSEVEDMASNQACDVIGLVMYVGRVERVKNKASSVSGKYWTYRWVHAVDGTSDCPFILEIFTSSQPEIFDNICPMTYLVCTQMRVCRGAGSSLYLTSSAETQLFITGCHRKQPYVSDPKVKGFIQWTKSLKESAVLGRVRVGGHYCYPPPPPTYTPPPSPAASAACEGSPSLMAVADLQREIESLHYREHRRVAIQGRITAVHYHSWPQVAARAAAITAQHTSQRIQQVERGSVSASDTGPVEQRDMPLAAPPIDSVVSPKRRKTDQGTTGVQRQYRTRAKVQSERQERPVYPQEEEDEESEEGHPHPNTVTPTPCIRTDNREASGTADLHPSASWESSVWALLKQDVVNHVCCGSLDQESISEKFSFDDRDNLLHKINLSPSIWSPHLPSNTVMRANTPVDFSGYFTLTILGLNQQAAVDAVFLPIYSSDDPRAVGTPAPGVNDNTLMSFLSLGGISVQRTESCSSPEVILSSGPALDHEKVVCVLDMCLLGPDRVELICSKVYQTVDVTPV